MPEATEHFSITTVMQVTMSSLDWR